MGQEDVEMCQDGLREEIDVSRSTQIQIESLQGTVKCQKPELEERVCNRHSFGPIEWSEYFCSLSKMGFFFSFAKVPLFHIFEKQFTFFFFPKKHFAFQT